MRPASLKAFKVLPPPQQAAKWVKQYRTGGGMSQARLAELAGLTQATISAIEAGRANPTLNTLQRIARVLQQDLVIGFRRHLK